MPTAPTTPSPNLTVEAIVAIETPREYRLHPRDRVVAYTAESAGTRQIFTLSLRGGFPAQLTASEKAASDPQWSPDGRRLAFVRDDEIWVVEADGSRLTRVIAKPGDGHMPRWSPDGHRLAFLSRRRGWTQIWLIDAPVPRRGRPATEPKPPRPTALTAPGIDVEAFEWAPDGARIAVMANLGEDPTETTQIVLVDVASGATRVVAGERSVDVGARWFRDGSLLFVSDADGFVESLLTQTLIIHIIRTAKIPFLESRASGALIATSLVVAGIGVMLPFTPLGATLGFVPLPPAYWLPLCLILLGYAVLTHLMKAWFSRRFGLV